MIIALCAAPLYAQQDHADVARAAYDASALPAPPRAVPDVLPFLARVLAMLPAGEQAGYVRAPAGGENAAFLPDGTFVRVGRVMYPNGQIFKVMSDVPNGGPQWVAEDVNPALYVPFAGHAPLPPLVVTPPPPTPAPVFDFGFVQWTQRTEARQMEMHNEILITKAQVGALTAKVDALAVKLEQHDNEPGWFSTVFGNRYVQLGLATLATWQVTK